MYERLKVFESGERAEQSYAEIALGLGMTESALKSAISRLRLRYRNLVREEVANTVASPNEVDEELRFSD